MTSPATKERPLRRDAQANRERIVAAARAAFATGGIEAPVEEIARGAGVGMGTLYRRFPTKEDLVDAVLEDAFGQFVRVAEEALAEEDAWVGFSGFLERALALHGADRGLKDLVASSRHGLARDAGDARAAAAADPTARRAGAGAGHAALRLHARRTCRSCSGPPGA